MKNRLMLVILVFLLGGYAGGCAMTKDYHLIKPISPKDAGWIDGGERVSRTPTFVWEGESDKLYDLSIWKVIDCINETMRITRARGPQVLYVEKIQGTTYKIKDPLEDDVFYWWSVKPHGTDKWSTCTRTGTIFIPYARMTLYNHYFEFTIKKGAKGG